MAMLKASQQQDQLNTETIDKRASGLGALTLPPPPPTISALQFPEKLQNVVERAAGGRRKDFTLGAYTASARRTNTGAVVIDCNLNVPNDYNPSFHCRVHQDGTVEYLKMHSILQTTESITREEFLRTVTR